MNIIDSSVLLTSTQRQLLEQHALVPFQLEEFTSIDEILTELDVDVVIEPGIIKREMHDCIKKAESYWHNEIERLGSAMHQGDETAEERFAKARRILERILEEKKFYGLMPLRGLYAPEQNVIKLFPEEMQTEYGGNKMDELLVSTLVHETMHAYFNRPGHNQFPYVLFVEEPLAEFGMLLYLHETQDQSYQWAYDDVNNKKTCYHYGATLMDQYQRGDISIRKYLEDFKIKLDAYQLPDVTPNKRSICLPKHPINGNANSSKWIDIIPDQIRPRYFYDNTTNTLGLDGDWSEWPTHNISFHMDIDIMIHHNPISQIYLGDNFTFDGNWDILDIFSKYNVVVSLANNQFYAKNGVPFYKKDNTPVLHKCGDGLYELCRNGKWGIVDAQLNQIVPFKYGYVWKFDDNDLIMVVNYDVKPYAYGLVNKQGKEQVSLQYEHITREGKNYKVKLNGQEFLIDKYGNRI